MDCERARDQFLSQLVTGEGGAWAEPVRRHLDGCQGCRTEVEELSRIWAALGRLAEAEPDAEVEIRLMRRVRRQVMREAVLTVNGWVPAVLAAAVGVALSLTVSLLVPYPWLVSVCQKLLQLAERDAMPYLVAGAVYGLPLALGAWVVRGRLLRGGVIGSLEATVLFLVILAPYVIAECREFPPALRGAFVSGLGVGALLSSLAGLALGRLTLPGRAHA